MSSVIRSDADATVADSPKSMPRLAVLDNAKGVMIFFVVFGHLIERLTINHNTIKSLYLSIYSFHMPAFVMLAGMTTSQLVGRPYLRRLAGAILVPFAIFTVAYELLEFALHGTISDYTKTAQPYWLLWFLLCLFYWRVVITFVAKVPGAIFFAFAASLVAGYFDSITNVLAASRTIYFFPFFLIGYQLTIRFFEKSEFFRIPKIIAIGILVANVVCFYYLRLVQPQWLYGSMPYSIMHMSGPLAALIRLGFCAVSLVTIFAILLLVPTRGSFLSVWGRGSLITYLLHGLVVKLLIYFGVMDFLGSLSPLICVPSCFVLAIVLIVVLSLRSVQAPIRSTFDGIARRLRLA